MQAIKMFLILFKNYFQARKVVKRNDEKELREFKDKLCKEIFDFLKIEVEIINKEYLDEVDSSIIMSNHKDNLDIFLLIYAIKNPINFLAKKELSRIPILNQYMKLSDTYFINRDSSRQGVKVLSQVVKDVNDFDNKNVVIFPEGTRAKSDLLNDFNIGLFSIVKKCNKKIIPVYIDGNSKCKKIKVIIGKPFNVKDMDLKKTFDLKEYVFNSISTLKKEYAINKTKYNLLGLGDSITFGIDCYEKVSDGFFNRFAMHLDNEGMLENKYNYAIPSINSDDFLNLLENNNYAYLFEKRMINYLKKDIFEKTLNDNELRLNQVIKKSDVILMSCGANDLLEVGYEAKGEKAKLEKEYYQVASKIMKSIELIKLINSKVKIIYIGIYYPYPHIKALAQFDTIKDFDQILKTKLEKSNVIYLSIYNEIKENKKTFLLNKRNIHLSDDGYKYLNDEIIKKACEIL